MTTEIPHVTPVADIDPTEAGGVLEVRSPEDQAAAREKLDLAQEQFDTAIKQGIDRAMDYAVNYHGAIMKSADKNKERSTSIATLQAKREEIIQAIKDEESTFGPNQDTSAKHRSLLRQRSRNHQEIKELEKKNGRVLKKNVGKGTRQWTAKEKSSVEYRTLRSGVDVIASELATRKRTRDEYNVPELKEKRRVQLEEKIESWDGETDGEYTERQFADLKVKHTKEVIPRQQEKLYATAYHEIESRQKVLEQLANAPDEATWRALDLKRKGWQSIPTIVRGDVHGFQQWIDQKAADQQTTELEEAAEAANKRKETLEEKTKLEAEAEEIQKKVAEIDESLKTETDAGKKKELTDQREKLSKEHEEAVEKHGVVLATITGWDGVSITDFHNEAINKAQRKFENRVKIEDLDL